MLISKPYIKNVLSNVIDLCFQEFGYGNSLKLHIDKVHKGVKNYKCDTFYESGKLKKYTDAIHKGIKKHKCPICNKKLVNPEI